MMGFRNLIAFILFAVINVMAQDFSTLQDYESDLSDNFDSLFKSDGVKFILPDRAKDSLNDIINKTFREALLQPESYKYSFSKLSRVGALWSKDKKLRVFTWNVKYENGTYKYFGYLQHYNEKKKSWDLFTLVDKSDSMTDVSHVTLTPNLWYGVSYYQIIEVKSGSKVYYTLLGWDGNNYLSQKKVIELLYFTRSGIPRFGKSVFKIGRKKSRRVIFEYNSQVVMALTYDKRYKRIVFDHLRPSPKNMKGNYKFYVPDGSYDAFEWKGGKWVYIDDFDAKNPKTKINERATPVETKKLYVH
jgi:hypothetical protein